MAKVFTKFGLKRDLNLSDLPNRTDALNNILKGLQQGTESFTAEDIELLKDIFVSDITKTTFTDASDATVLELKESGISAPYDPLITFSNRIDKAYFTTSEPFFFGGDGPTTRYYDNAAIVRSTPGNAATNFEGFEENSVAETTLFWERGNFFFDGKFLAELVSIYGAVEWTGYFKPVQNGVHNLRIITRGFLKVEFDDLSQTRDFTFDPGTGTFNYNNNDFDLLNVVVDQTRLDQSTNLSTATIVNTNNSPLGDARTVTINLGSLSAYEAYKIRITHFISEDAVPTGVDISRAINFDILPPSSGSYIDLNYKYLYSESYFTNYNIGDFKAFIDKTISLGGTEIGSNGTIGDVSGSFIESTETPTLGDSYKNLNNLFPIISYYQFPNNISSVEKDVAGCSLVSGRSIISFDENVNTEPDPTENIEIGNYVFGTGIPVGCRVTKVIQQSSIEVSPTPTTTGTVTLTFVNHRGLVSYGIGDVANNNVTNITDSFSLTDIKTNQILLSNGLSFTYNDDTIGVPGSTADGKLIQEYDGSQIILKNTDTPAAIGNQKFYIYQTSGLNSDGLDFFCQDAVKTRLLATNNDTTSDTVILQVEDTSEISLGDYVHAFPTINYGTRSDGSVTETFSRVQVTEIDVAGVPNTVKITRTVGTGAALLSGLEYNPDKIKNIVFTTSDINKEVCFRPTDTSPPFSANSTGLTTPNDVSFVDDFTSNGGGNFNPDSTITYSDLNIVTNENNLYLINPAIDRVTKYIPITDSTGTEYYIMMGDDPN